MKQPYGRCRRHCLWSSLVLMLMMETVGGVFQRAKMSEDNQRLCLGAFRRPGGDERERLPHNIRKHSTGLRKDRVIKVTCFHLTDLEVRQFSAEGNKGILSREMASFSSQKSFP